MDYLLGLSLLLQYTLSGKIRLSVPWVGKKLSTVMTIFSRHGQVWLLCVSSLCSIMLLNSCGKPKHSEIQPQAGSEPATNKAKNIDAKAAQIFAQNICPDHAMVATSIEELTNLFDQVSSLSSKSEDPANLAQLVLLSERLRKWQNENCQLIANCSMLLGADGTDAKPEIRMSLESLRVGGASLEKAINGLQMSGGNNRSYLRSVRKALTRSAKVLHL